MYACHKSIWGTPLHLLFACLFFVFWVFLPSYLFVFYHLQIQAEIRLLLEFQWKEERGRGGPLKIISVQQSLHQETSSFPSYSSLDVPLKLYPEVCLFIDSTSNGADSQDEPPPLEV